MTAPFVRIRNLSVTYNRWGVEVHALRAVNIDLFLGEMVTLTGPNGSGKSSLIRALCGEVPFEGQIQFPEPDSKRSGRFYSVQQNPIAGTAGSLTVLENLWLIDESPPHRRSTAAAKYAALLTPIGLSDMLNQSVESLSGGQRQILAVSMVTLTSHPLILLDEPTSALDPENEKRCLNIMQSLAKAGRCILHISHDADHRLLADRVFVLQNGTMAEVPALSNASSSKAL